MRLRLQTIGENAVMRFVLECIVELVASLREQRRFDEIEPASRLGVLLATGERLESGRAKLCG